MSQPKVVAVKAPGPVGRTLLLEHAAADFLVEITREKPWRRARYEDLLDTLETYLGRPAPLLAYTRATGEAWLRALHESEREDARDLLTEFRAYLRDWGWLDLARPVNQLD
ncbi:hypothetical protein K7W42_01030 [Deinococcus sp. HMF7604]|uniref:hypothetical protein n=1 Tax=Deinococcus betulae TaxID=2873312 RepID=UPI001CCBDD29|nr:hypothetical protein [Deinococcus betulae]MBZ9749436.1 hypothetical protein [Deinococcus betulae]